MDVSFVGDNVVTFIRYPFITAAIFLLCLAFAGVARADPSLIGQTGLINMPDARIEEDGILRLGVSNNDPYLTIWSSVTMLPRLELSGRYTVINDYPAVDVGPEYGDVKDKAFDAKLLLLRESHYIPDISIGTQDFLGTKIFSTNFVTLSKRIQNLDMTLGYGEKRIDGLFGGIRYVPGWNKNLGIVIEYDANDYPNDPGAALSGADHRSGGSSFGIEYKFGWIGTQLAYQDGDLEANAYVSIPLMKREFIPNVDEPEPYSESAETQPVEVWRKERQYTHALARALDEQGFKNVQLAINDKSLHMTLTHPRISLIGRAVGRAVRTLLMSGPGDMEAVIITYTINDQAILSYRFNDLQVLQGHFDGLISLPLLQKSMVIEYASPGYIEQFGHQTSLFIDLDEAEPLQMMYGDEGHFISFKKEDRFLSSVHFIPFNMRFYFNDPSGAFHYDIFSLLQYNKYVHHGLFLKTSARLTLFEDVSEVSLTSNSLLPHVRSDVAEYKSGDRVRLNNLLLNQYFQPARRVYGRVSAGYYEEMYGGSGGQMLYLSAHGNWAVDLSVDWLKQREPGGELDFRDYSVVSALGAFHYRVPRLGLTATARMGRFLAKDEGARVELKRRFRSGIEVGAWYTVTNKDDITSPGSPDDPYHDKGIFISIPLSSMLTRDSQDRANLSLAPWTRDVGQMVESPDDLYRLLERPLMLDSGEHTPLTGFDL